MFGSEANSDSTNGRDLSNDLKELGENTSNLHITPTHPNTNDENYNIRYLYASESTNRSNLNKSEEMPGKYLNYQQGEKRKTALSLQLSKQPDVLSEFAELSTNEELRFIHNEYFNSNNRKPLSGRKLIQLGDNSSPYLKCSKFFTEVSHLLESKYKSLYKLILNLLLTKFW
ncbi:hypothetical protein RF11_06111 [Thelohanellus kitauei]|uniref:Uncharacterized protein n=1 Tax=Thelohanellus kitauei TaxID=669202 RepID=A0A0C2I6R1_THEKT|nr:hypothetical protein RF11_06111 [Thelohanellus kitauei]